MLIVLLWFVLAVVVGVAASHRGRSGGGWFFLALILSPLIGFLILAVLPDLDMQDRIDDLQFGAGVNERELRRNVERR
jgi:hypothetical protein